ncbi:MAG TPA: phosphatase PAP2 family protein [Gemmatimonadales bacterium]|nr:phosphatase PAP2 family protein [Gemmatimonadales bacterium]
MSGGEPGQPRRLREALREDRALIGVMSLYALAALPFGAFRPVGHWIAATAVTAAITGAAVWLYLPAWDVWRESRRSGVRLAARNVARRLRRTWPERLARWLLILVVLRVFFEGVRTFKSAIPLLHPFSWDAPLMELDRVLHFGRHPWQWLHPMLGRPGITRALDWAYDAWYGVALYGLVAFACSGRNELRARFLWSFVLAWILLATVAAAIFSSAGPCYYGAVTGLADPYAPLMTYLGQASAERPLHALETQALLWAGYTGRIQPALGIAAMPSLHVAMPVLLATATWSISRALSGAFAAYAAVILVGSVHLGWHYAVDGYFSALAVPLLWWAVGRALGPGTRSRGVPARAMDAAAPG